MKIKKYLATFFLVAMAFGMTGCGAVLLGGAAAGGTYVYVSGSAEQQFNVDVSQAYSAALKTCKSFGLTVESKVKRLADAEIKAKDQDTTVYIDIENTSRKVVKVSVRYGILGDEQASKKIIAGIKRNL